MYWESYHEIRKLLNFPKRTIPIENRMEISKKEIVEKKKWIYLKGLSSFIRESGNIIQTSTINIEYGIAFARKKKAWKFKLAF